jgi:hypothetical protein
MDPDTNRRRPTVRWSSAPEEGDAGEAVAETEAWLARVSPAADWEGLLGEVRDALLRAGLLPLLMEDPEARDALLGLAEAADDAEALDAGIDRLRRRIDALVTSRERAALAVPRTAAAIAADQRGARPARTIFKV